MAHSIYDLLSKPDITENHHKIDHTLGNFQNNGDFIIPEGVTQIEPYTFSNCENLHSIYIPDSMVLIGWNAFANTPWFENQPDGLVYAGNVAYAYKGEMPVNTHIALRDGTLGIAGGAFYNYRNLIGITIPNAVITIGNIAFLNCINLIDVNIPDSVRYIEPLAFEYTAWMNSQPDGMVYAGSVAYEYKGRISQEGHITLRDGTVSVTSGAFAHAEKLHRLRSVTIPESVTYIGENLFTNCAEDFNGNVTIRCNKDSCAHNYAKTNGAKVELL